VSTSNYRDLSTSSTDLSAGFQFEFFCEQCGEGVRSPFTPYRKGQITGWLSRFSFLFNDLNKASRATGAFADAGAQEAKAEALAQAKALLLPRFKQCEACHKAVGAECWNSSAQMCNSCLERRNGQSGPGAVASHSGGGMACPNCQTPSEGGRFCHECGFDMASTHKSCPTCGVTLSRQARFCTDCGHGF
jgi:hypothetical protein